MKYSILSFALMMAGSSFSQTENNDTLSGPISVQTSYGEIFTAPDVAAQFPGGKKALAKFLREHLNYPKEAIEHGIEGKCYLQFVISASGNISNVNVMRGVPDCPECDTESVRVVRAMPQWIPATVDGKNVHSIFNFPIQFTIAGKE